MKHTKRNYYFIFLILLVLVFMLFLVISLSQNSTDEPQQQPQQQITWHVSLPSDRFKLMQANISTGLPDNFTNDFVEIITDIFWDYDNSTGTAGQTDLFPIAWSYVPGFGSNGGTTVNILFLLAFSGGILFAVEKWG